MSHNVIAVYPGTFDPITLGHEDIIRRAGELFDQVIVAVAMAYHKKTLFSLDERLALVRAVTAAWPHVCVAPFEGLITRFTGEQGGTVMVRGLRSGTDFDYEFQLADMNRHLVPTIETVFLTPDHDFQSISSTLVREITLLQGNAAQFVSPAVWRALVKKRDARA
jgi:pantetheine-phosphate adenylyltransferase